MTHESLAAYSFIGNISWQKMEKKRRHLRYIRETSIFLPIATLLSQRSQTFGPRATWGPPDEFERPAHILKKIIVSLAEFESSIKLFVARSFCVGDPCLKSMTILCFQFIFRYHHFITSSFVPSIFYVNDNLTLGFPFQQHLKEVNLLWQKFIQWM